MADEIQKSPEATAPEAAAPSPGPSPGPGPGPRPGGGSGPGGGSRFGPRRGPRPGGPPREGGRKFFRRRKVCKFCVEKIDAINYKDVRLLQQFVGERGKIVPRRITGVCTPHQRRVSAAIKQARNIALLAFSGR